MVCTQRRVQFSLSVIVKPRCQAEISNFDFHRIVEKQVCELEVAMYDLSAVKVGTRMCHLMYEITTLRLRDCAPALV